jgi:hypothetical protein
MPDQALHDEPPLVVVLPQMAPSLPRTKTSIAPLVGEVAAGEEVRAPPRECQLDHDVPVYVLYHRAPSVPCTKTSGLPAGPDALPASESIVDFNVAASIGYTKELATVPAGLIT